MRFPWNKYSELESSHVNTLQVFITNRCNLKCEGCFVRNVMSEENKNISYDEYVYNVARVAHSKNVLKINLLGGEPFLHPELIDFVKCNVLYGIKSTIYTNGHFLSIYSKEDLKESKIRVSVYSFDGYKGVKKIKIVDTPVEFCFMVSSETTVEELLKTSEYIEDNFNCSVFFISSIRELDNKNKEFFEDTQLTMPILDYKKIVHLFLSKYDGNMDIHISKRGVFESTCNKALNECRFANYFIGGKIIQCPYDIINLKYQDNYSFNNGNRRFCKHNSTCLMTKIILSPKKKDF